MVTRQQSPLSRAWLRMALRMHGAKPADLAEALHGPDILLAALESMGGSEDGNWRLLA